MRVLVTGAQGFVGTWACRRFADQGDLSYPLEGQEHLDILDLDSVDRLVRGLAPDAILHLAAVSNGIAARKSPERAFSVNVGGTINLLEVVRTMRPPPAVLVAGTGEVYGWPAPSELPLREDSPLRPRGPYATSKAGQESVALAYRARYGLPIVVTRAFNHSGPGQVGPQVLPSLARRVLAFSKGEATSVLVGNLDVARDLLDVRDVVDAYGLLLRRLAADHSLPVDVVNIAAGRTVPIRRLLEQLCRLAGVSPPIVTDPALVRLGEPADLTASTLRLHSLIAWEPRHDVTTMVADLWDSIAAEGAR